MTVFPKRTVASTCGTSFHCGFDTMRAARRAFMALLEAGVGIEPA
jgi:hypothetical protein